ncbi:MAG: hypothetical protein EOP46_05280 [Sphingobacteriaceae bacterium]|nr:MAG: hypothetical protein EOP46_05280 [Sphingobacteriaceae bacterium]
MKIYDIKYQEIYNELLDHVITGIEERRVAGDGREISIVFQNVIDDHFNGYTGIEEVARLHEKAYRQKVNRMLRDNLKYYINWQSFTYVLAALIIGMLLPDIKIVVKILTAVVFVMAFVPMLYSYIEMRKVKGGKGKYSLIHAYVTSQAALPITILNCVIFLPKLFQDEYNLLLLVPPVFLVMLIALLYIYMLSCIRLCKQELQSVINI